ncbi:DUF6461 domain-containing protein [Saccharopolyspora gregorii]|uniref:Uncharacterized protein n=1 Tax=Saccharopolyspora gregorii TaxID=33914 RepID=A0ABP6RNM0_9PSEU
MTSADDFGWLDDDSIVGYSVAFVEGVDPGEALRRIGAEVDARPASSAAEADEIAGDSGGAAVVRAGRCGGWTALVEHDANSGVNEATLPALSVGTRVVSVFSSASGMDLFYFAENGQVTTVVETSIPANRSGGEPDRFLAEMADVGLVAGEIAESVRAATMALAREVCGVELTEEMMFDARLQTGLVS